MDDFSVIIVIFLGLLITIFAATLLLSIIYNVSAGVKYREPLTKRLHSLRLSKMLSALGINTSEYLNRVNVVTIHEQMNRCTDCDNTEKCDDNLSNEEIDINEIEFCDNESSLKDLVSNKNVAQ